MISIEEVKKVADKLGIALAHQTFQSEALQSFFTRAYELGWKNRGESDDSIPKKQTKRLWELFCVGRF